MAGLPVRNEQGQWVIPATRRPDGTWRKEIQVKEGYVPPDEMGAYVPAAARALKSRGVPGLPPGAPPPAPEPPKKPRRRAKKEGSVEGADKDTEILSSEIETALNLAPTEIIASAAPVADADPAKAVKRLEKKLREIQEIEKKALDGVSLTPEQVEKMSKKESLMEELSVLKDAKTS